jgi:putative sigma-54 modulation protein
VDGVHIEITTRHGTLGATEQAYLQEKAERLRKIFGRLMAIEIEVEHEKKGWKVEIFVSAEHKHDFIAREVGSTPEAAMDQCVHKIEEQLRRYKERVQRHRGDTPQGGTSPLSPDLPEPPAPEPEGGPGPT